jgi:type III secretion protein Q
MKASNKLVQTEQGANPTGEVPIDPFAIDFFGAKSAPAGEIVLHPLNEPAHKKQTRPAKKSSWHKNLPRLSNREAEFSAAIESLPGNLTAEAARIIGESVARYTFRQPENVKCTVISAREVSLREAAADAARSPQIFLSIGCRPEDDQALAAINADFALSVIDLILGGQAAETENARSLSPIETTIVEFLAVNILGEINNYLGEPLLCLQNLTNEPASVFDKGERGARLSINIELDRFSGTVSVLASRNFLNTLDRTQNPLLLKKSKRTKLGDFEKIIRRLDLCLQVGTTALDAESLLFLEPDDVVLVEQPGIDLKNGNFGRDLQITVGRGRNFRLKGTLSEEGDATGGGLNFQIGEILSEEARRTFTPAKFKMDEKDNELTEAEETAGEATGRETDTAESVEENQEEQISPALENVQIALRVEIASNKISLREIQNFRPGQVIALGCRPTDPVRLVTDNNEEPIATGELVEIEGQLGVRLTKVFI